MEDWQLAEAKNRFSEVVTLALTRGPQRVHRRNQAVIVLSEKEYRHLKGKRPSFTEYLMKGPSFEGMEIERDTSPMRDVDL